MKFKNYAFQKFTYIAVRKHEIGMYIGMAIGLETTLRCFVPMSKSKMSESKMLKSKMSNVKIKMSKRLAS
jgi:hypothetical protein